MANNHSDIEKLMLNSNSGLLLDICVKNTEMDEPHNGIIDDMQVVPIECSGNTSPGASGVENSTNWREIWDKYIVDCTNRKKKQHRSNQNSDGKNQNGNTRTIYTRRSYAAKYQGRQNQQPTASNKKPRWYHYKKKTVSPTEESSIVLDSKHLWNLYTDFVQKPTIHFLDPLTIVDNQEADAQISLPESGKTPINVIKTVECSPLYANTENVLSCISSDLNWTKMYNLYTDFVYKPFAPTKKWWHTRKSYGAVIPKQNGNVSGIKQRVKHYRPPLKAFLDNTTESGNAKSISSSGAASNFEKQKPKKNPVKSLSKENSSQTNSNCREFTPRTSAGKKNKQKRTTKGNLIESLVAFIQQENYSETLPNSVKRKRFNKNNTHLNIFRKNGANHEMPTTNWNHLLHLYLDFVGNPMGDCTIKNHLSNDNVVFDKFANSEERTDNSMKDAENWSYLWNLYTDLLNNPHRVYVAIGCEIAKTHGPYPRRKLARVSVTDQKGNVLFDKPVKTLGIVSDCTAENSEDCEKGEKFVLVRKEVHQLIKNKIVVGHNLRHDLGLLHIRHPVQSRRDTATYRPLRSYAPNGRSDLERLCETVLGYENQVGKQSSVEKAQSVMKIYNCISQDWESSLTKHQSGK